MKSIKGEGIRFLVVGGANTLFTYIVYLVLLPPLGYVYAFTVSFAVGVVFAFVAYTSFVFRSSLKWQKLYKYPFLYIAQYISGLTLLSLLIKWLGLDERIAPVVNVIVLTPLTFFLNKWFLAEKGK